MFSFCFTYLILDILDGLIVLILNDSATGQEPNVLTGALTREPNVLTVRPS